MAINSGHKTNKKQQEDMETRRKQQYDIDQNPGPRSEAQKLYRIKKRKERAQRRVESKAGILIPMDVYCLWQANNRAWSPGNGITTLYLKELTISAIYQPLYGTENHQVELEGLRKEAERVIRTTKKVYL